MLVLLQRGIGFLILEFFCTICYFWVNLFYSIGGGLLYVLFFHEIGLRAWFFSASQLPINCLSKVEDFAAWFSESVAKLSNGHCSSLFFCWLQREEAFTWLELPWDGKFGVGTLFWAILNSTSPKPIEAFVLVYQYFEIISRALWRKLFLWFLVKARGDVRISLSDTSGRPLYHLCAS